MESGAWGPSPDCVWSETCAMPPSPDFFVSPMMGRAATPALVTSWDAGGRDTALCGLLQVRHRALQFAPSFHAPPSPMHSDVSRKLEIAPSPPILQRCYWRRSSPNPPNSWLNTELSRKELTTSTIVPVTSLPHFAPNINGRIWGFFVCFCFLNLIDCS